MKNSYIFLCIVMLFFSKQLTAGDIKLISGHWDFICKVEIISGKKAPYKGDIEFYEHIRKGWSVSKPFRLCYRRPLKPSDCKSNYGKWVCATMKRTGVQKQILR